MTALLIVGFNGTAFAQVDIKNPKTYRDFYARGQQHEREKRIDEAIADYRKSGELNPDYFDAHFTRSGLLADKKDYRGSVDALTDALKARPGSFSALFNRGLYHQYLTNYDAAIADYTRAAGEDADFSFSGGSREENRAHAYHNRGRVYQWYKKDQAKAAADYTAALRLDPDIHMVHYRRGQAYHDLGKYAEAHRDFETAFEKEPEYPRLLNSWAWQLATCPDEKFRDGRLAFELAILFPDMNVLAAAYAETNRFDEAIEAQRQAIKQLDRQRNLKPKDTTGNRTELRREMLKRLRQYEAGQPHRDE